jgi:hypothetical protein
MSGSGNQGRGHTIRRRTREAPAVSAPETDADALSRPPQPLSRIPEASSRMPVERSSSPGVATAFDRAPPRAVSGSRPTAREQETLKVGGHVIRLERDDDRVHLVLGGVFRLVMTLDEAQQVSAALAALGKPPR